MPRLTQFQRGCWGSLSVDPQTCIVHGCPLLDAVRNWIGGQSDEIGQEEERRIHRSVDARLARSGERWCFTKRIASALRPTAPKGRPPLAMVFTPLC